MASAAVASSPCSARPLPYPPVALRPVRRGDAPGLVREHPQTRRAAVEQDARRALPDRNVDPQPRIAVRPALDVQRHDHGRAGRRRRSRCRDDLSQHGHRRSHQSLLALHVHRFARHAATQLRSTCQPLPRLTRTATAVPFSSMTTPPRAAVRPGLGHGSIVHTLGDVVGGGGDAGRCARRGQHARAALPAWTGPEGRLRCVARDACAVTAGLLRARRGRIPTGAAARGPSVSI